MIFPTESTESKLLKAAVFAQDNVSHCVRAVNKSPSNESFRVNLDLAKLVLMTANRELDIYRAASR